MDERGNVCLENTCSRTRMTGEEAMKSFQVAE